MFSKAERNFLELMAKGEVPTINEKYGRVLCFRIRKKINSIETDLELVKQARKHGGYWYNTLERIG